jgi:hypothetical protein
MEMFGSGVKKKKKRKIRAGNTTDKLRDHFLTE